MSQQIADDLKLDWRKSRASMANANCVEVAPVDRGVSWILPDTA